MLYKISICPVDGIGFYNYFVQLLMYVCAVSLTNFPRLNIMVDWNSLPDSDHNCVRFCRLLRSKAGQIDCDLNMLRSFYVGMIAD